MFTTLLSILLAGLILFVIYYIAGKFMVGQPLNIVGIILGIIFVVYALRTSGLIAA